MESVLCLASVLPSLIFDLFCVLSFVGMISLSSRFALLLPLELESFGGISSDGVDLGERCDDEG